MNYQNKILNKLIDKYEKSKHYSDKTAFTKRIYVYCGDFINVEDPYENKQFLSDILELREKNFIDCDWERKDLVVNRIWLIIDNVNCIYKYLGRRSRNDEVNDVLVEIERLSVDIQVPWIKEYLHFQYDNIKGKNKLTGMWRTDIKLIREILSALGEIDRLNGKSVFMRTFSIDLYSDSKYFERNIKKYITDIARKNEPVLRENDELSEREILQQLGIVMMSEIFEFCGNIAIKFKNGIVDFSPIKNGACISGDCIEDILSVEVKGVSKIIFIENKTNYSEYCLKNRKEDELVIFHGGFYSPQKGKFFRGIHNAAASTPIFFWADIDYGGFRMFVRLKDNIIPELQPMNMSVMAHKEHSQRLLERSDEYIEKLLSLCNDEKYSMFYDVIMAIASSHGTVEQECFLLDDNIMLV